jgi:outer membrane receptor protein involved in Fe transport
MKTRLAIFLFLLSNSFLFAQSGRIQLSGKIKDKNSGEALPGVTVAIKGTTDGAQTDADGKFVLKAANSFPLTLMVTYIGYEKQEYVVESEKSTINFEIKPQSILVNEIVVSASRVEENILKSPVAIDKLDIIALRETPAASFYDAMENIKGVQLTTSSLSFKIPNTRGFNSPNNFRFMQLVDGVDIQAPTLGASIGNTIGPNELDIRSVEIIPGSSSALYGINSINGLANLQTKNPFLNKGVSVYQRTGINHVDDIDHALSFLSETAFRVAGTVGAQNKFAYRLNASHFQGVDWLSSNATDQNPFYLTTSNPKNPEFTSGENNPAYDAWNKYGDEKNNVVSVTAAGKTYNVRRTGYWEKDLVHPDVNTTKADIGWFYKLDDKSQINYVYRVGTMDGIFQRGNKVQLDNVLLQSHAIEYKNRNLQVRAYTNSENTGNSYNLKPTADNLDLSFKNNTVWKNDYQAKLVSALGSGADQVTAHQLARAAADAGRPTPGSEIFNAQLKDIINTNNWDHPSIVAGTPSAVGGAAFWQKSRTHHGEFQYDLSSLLDTAVNVLIGADARTYEVIPDGNNFVDFSRPVASRTTPDEKGSYGKNQYYSKFGGFLQVSKELFKKKIKIVGSIRYDRNPEFEGKINPRAAIVYSPNKRNSVRLSYQDGYRFPALFEALSFVNNGNVRRVGGLEKVNEGLGYLENSYTQVSVDNFNNAIKGLTGPAKTAAILANKSLLVVADLPKLRPEHIKAFDFGYKSILFDNKLIIDLDAYYNIMDGFLGQVEVVVPKNLVNTDSSAFDIATNTNVTRTRYRVYTNAINEYFAYGSAARISYNFYGGYTISGNVNYNDLKIKGDNDVFITGFNTPKWSFNAQLGNREIIKNLGFNIVWKWQDAYTWESPLATGRVAAFNTIDAQLSYKVPAIKTSIKVGATNLLNYRYIQYAAGPTIGGLYYVSLTFDAPFSN